MPVLGALQNLRISTIMCGQATYLHTTRARSTAAGCTQSQRCVCCCCHIRWEATTARDVRDEQEVHVNTSRGFPGSNTWPGTGS